MTKSQDLPHAACIETPAADERDLAAPMPVAAATALPLDADPPETRHEPVRIDRVVERLLKRMGLDACPWIEQLAEAWPTLLPAAVAKGTRPGKWENNILYVYVPNSMRLYEVRRNHLPAIEKAVRQFAGDARVRAVRLTIDPG